MDRLLVRQAIFNKKEEVCAYELLYEREQAQPLSHNPLAPLIYTSPPSIIEQIFKEIDVSSVIGNKEVYITFNYDLIIEQLPTFLSHYKIVTEIDSVTTIDEKLIECLTKLSRSGFKIALDDFVYCEENLPLIHLAHVIKIDVSTLNRSEIEKQIAPIRAAHFKGQLLAKHTDDRDHLKMCTELGFDYFQGLFLNQPTLVKSSSANDNKEQFLQLTNELFNTEITLEEIEKFILRRPKLSYNILRLTSSVAFYTGKKVDTEMEAINHMGLGPIRNWLIVLLLTNIRGVAPDLFVRTLIRAEMGELLAQVLEQPHPHQAYTVGILSTLDAIFNEPLPSLITKIHLNDTLTEALIHHQGILGTILKITTDYEAAHFNALKNCGIQTDNLLKAYLEGIAYADSMLHIIQN